MNTSIYLVLLATLILSANVPLRTETNIINDLESSPNPYILVFPEKAPQRGGEVWDWIESHTQVIYSAQYQNTTVELHR